GRLRFADQLLGSVIQLARPIPSIGLVSFAIIWFGLGDASKVFLVAWGAFFPIWLNTHLGVREVNRTLVWAAASLGASRRQILLHVVLPAAMSYVVAGVRTAIGIGFVCLVAAEMAGAFGAGLGFRVEASHLVFRTDRMLAALLTLAALGAGCDWLFQAAIRSIAPWVEQERGGQY